MHFRPCIDIHNGKVKQIIGGSLKDVRDSASENFISVYDAAFYANFYKEKGIRGGHIIMLNPFSSAYFMETKGQALLALRAYPGGLQIGGGITADNAGEYLEAGASHVIITSYVFKNGAVLQDNLKKLVQKVGKEKLVLDLSCRKKENQYYIMTDRWQKYTDVVLTEETMAYFSPYCSEFLIHAVDVEGKADGIETDLMRMLGGIGEYPVTYAGGVHSFADLQQIKELGKGKVDVTIGSALDLFGGSMKLEAVLTYLEAQ